MITKHGQKECEILLLSLSAESKCVRSAMGPALLAV